VSEISLQRIAVVRNGRASADDDNWGEIVSEVVLDPSMPEESLEGIDAFSHVEIVFQFHLVAEEQVVISARHPRDNPDWPKVGIFAQRGRMRPNRLGVSVAKILRREGRSLFVEGLDAVDGTPVLDIKPVMVEFLPRAPVRQPDWSHELMKDYWSRK
jgi:tRNA-Thr(GGU) m(6)t(6)A37 methyltransferase TsaA